MLERWSRIGAPVFKEDPDKTRDANALNLVLLGLGAYLVLNAFGVVLVYAQKPGATALLLALLIVILVSRWLMRRGLVYLASLTIVSGLWIIFSVLTTLAGGVYSAGLLTYALVCVVAGLLLGLRAAIVALAASVVVVLGLAAAQALGHPPPQVFPSRPGAMLLFYTLLLVLIAAILAFYSMRYALDLAHEHEQRYRQVIEQAVDGILITDAAGRTLLANSALSDMLGFTAEEVRELHVLSTYLPEEQQIGADRLRRVGAGERLRFERPMLRKDGTSILVEVTASRLDDGRLQAIIRDVSERKRAEHALRESEERFHRLSAAAFEGIGITDAGRIVDVNQRLADMLGYEIAELLELRVLDLVAPEDHDVVLGHIRSGSEERYVHLAMRKDGVRFPVEVQGRNIPFHGRTLRVTAIRDISDRYRAEEALRRSEEQYRAVFDGVRDVIFAMSPQGTLTSLNAVFEEITGWSREEWLGQPFIGLLHPDDVPQATTLLQAVLHDQPRPTAQLRVRTRRGDFVVGEFRTSAQRKDGHVVGVLGIARDISDRLDLEQQLRQAQKMEAVGQLAGGIAHDFNNLLTVIMSYGQLRLLELSAGDPGRADLEEITRAARQAADLTRQLLAFSRRQVLEMQVLNLNDVVGGIEKMLKRVIGEDIDLVATLAPDLGAVRADPGQLEQVIMNLAVNARDAMPDGGRLTIETTNAEPHALFPGLHEPMAPGPYVLLTVSDTGVGIDEATKIRVFEPFFTTKERGKGTGLGLATVYGIVKQSDGYIWVHSEPGRGAAFKICLPRVGEAAEALRPHGALAETRGGTETILVVEDEAPVRRVVREVLHRLGYKVLEAEGPNAAQAIAGVRREPPQLLVTDVLMPELNGRELARRLDARWPGLKVLYPSGYTDEAIVRHGVLEPGVAFLQKPFTPEGLAQKVREVLDSRG